MKIYFAGPLFTAAERAWISTVRDGIEARADALKMSVRVCWPYELITAEEIKALGDKARSEIFERCRSNLDDSDMVVALLDGTQVDDGTAWEIGYFHARGRGGIVGIRTDFRRAGEAEGSVVNAMIEMSCDRIVRSDAELLETLEDVWKRESQS